MRAYDRSQPLISLHIPKCGGRSLTEVLKSWFEPNFFRHYYLEKTAQKPPRHNLSATGWRRKLLRQRYRPGVCIHGHFDQERGFGVPAYYPDVKQFITVLRDPFQIALSDYFYIKRRGDDWFFDGKRMPIAERYPSFNEYFEVEVLPRRTYIANYLPVETTLESYAKLFDQLYVYVGLTEELPTAVQRLARKLGKPPVEIPRINESPRDEVINPQLEQRFIDTHPLDYALYEYARQHYRD